MNLSEPSFRRLFRRSHYRCGPDEDDESEEAKDTRKERERFAVAALAFCLRHDRKFLAHFWSTVCRVPDDESKMPCIKPEGILLEPPRWADLRLVSEEERTRQVWVIEVKAGAPLECRQRPDRPDAFTEPGKGYGALFQKEEAHPARLRYIILGARESDELRIHPGRIRRIWVQQRTWEDLTKGLKRTGIVADLFSMMGELRIEPFFMEKAERITVDSELSNVDNAQTVLHAMCDWLSYRKLRISIDSGYMGIYVEPSGRRRPLGKYALLHKVTRKKGGSLAWFGYEIGSEKQGRVRKGVWLCFDDRTSREAMCKKLKKRFPDNDTKSDYEGDYHYVKVYSPRRKPSDFKWFKSVFEEALS